MRNYKNGKIYAIKSYQTDEVYIGSTCEKYLTNRLKSHRQNYKAWQAGKNNFVSSFLIIDNYPDYYIELIENCPCDNIEELSKRERYWIQSGDYKVVNTRIPGRTIYEWRKDNKEKISEKGKIYQQKNKDKIEKRRSIKITCVCGREMRRDNLTTHLKSPIHTRTLLKKNNCFEEIFTYVNNK
jgi:hypothetical protein